MKKILAIAISAALLSTACVSDAGSQTYTSPQTTAPYTQALHAVSTDYQLSTLTMEQIMADPDWMGRSPGQAHFSLDGKSIYFSQKREGSQVYDVHQVLLEDARTDLATATSQVAFEQLHLAQATQVVAAPELELQVYVYKNNVFTYHTKTHQITQLTQDQQVRTNLQRLNNGLFSYRQGNQFYTIDVHTGQTKLHLNLVTTDKPVTVEAPADYLAQEDVDLFLYNQVQRKNRQDAADHQEAIAKQDPTLAPQPFYLGAGLQVTHASLSPQGDLALVAVGKPNPWRGESDLMPRFVTESGRIEMQPVRNRVADAKPYQETLYLLNLQTGEQQELAYDTLPGFDEDVLKAVKEENHKAQGKAYKSKKTPRHISLSARWAASSGNIVWADNGKQAAVMLRAWDNKDRWIATVDFNKKALVPQHRLHDEAWITHDFNQMGWLPDHKTLWYNSEESGYSHLYIKDTGSKKSPTQLTSGKFLVDQVTLSKDGKHFYFQANIEHPGVFNLYRVNKDNKQIEAITQLPGMLESYELDAQEQQVVYTYSESTKMPEVYVQALEPSATAVQITDTASDAFKQLDWQKPSVVAIPSSQIKEGIYSRVYLPEGYDAASAEQYPAVIFIHGAGYLHNAHEGWSNYFREFMFHQLLTQKGYVVLDLDYRGSAGYGRDWRTAVYRQMGIPEVEDLVDVKNWAIANTKVDGERVGIYGGSYGGFLTFMGLLREPGQFKAGAALRPVSDWAHYNIGYTSNILNLPQDDPIAYKRSSPIYYADGLQDALLINAPMVDDNVFFQDSVRIVQRFIELEKDNFETAIFPVEPHGFVQPSSWLNEYRKIFKLFEDNLKK